VKRKRREKRKRRPRHACLLFFPEEEVVDEKIYEEVLRGFHGGLYMRRPWSTEIRSMIESAYRRGLRDGEVLPAVRSKIANPSKHDAAFLKKLRLRVKLRVR